ncbi:transcriptional regulator TbsP domain-containing protein [Halobacterium rubrum]|uniref:transcriptional regulator TbsP domain-containing protein n=1 Tax=Halobacterium TaxID=2239 RepID=UPI001F1E2EF6|nr:MULTISPECIES: DUF5821 family protein [Halobacterium]MDH5021802.1 DUF5821 family protein [Halobacterium rubrum]
MPLSHAESSTDSSTEVDDSVRALDAALKDATESVFLIGPSVSLIRELAKRFGRANDELSGSSVRVLAEESVLDTATDDTLTEYRLAAPVEEGSLEIRSSEPATQTPGSQNTLPSVILTESKILAVINPGYIADSSSDYVDQVTARYDGLWEDAEPYGSFSKTATFDVIEEVAREKFSFAFVDDLWEVFLTVDTLGTRDDPIGVEDVVFAIATQHEETQYQVGKFCEDTQIVSPATVSRVKRFYDDVEAIETSRVPQDRGRPRDRLFFADDDLASADAETLVRRLREIRETRSL